jgi:hypothetical protein
VAELVSGSNNQGGMINLPSQWQLLLPALTPSFRQTTSLTLDSTKFVSKSNEHPLQTPLATL